MHHITLDTNTWIYLANGTEPSKLLKFLIDESSRGNIRIIVPQIIVEEWNRNKDNAVKQGAIQHFKDIIDDFDRISKLLGEKGEPDVFSFVTGDDKSKDKEYFHDYIKKFRTRQKEVEDAVNENIRSVDDLFKSKYVIEVPVSETVIIQSAKNALAKKAPFLKKNSFADAVIMFSFLEYVTANNIEDSLFVSYNTDDFCEKKDGKKLLHPDLVPEFTSAKATFYHIVGEALQTIKEDIISKEELELIRDLQDEDEGKSERCVVCEQNDRYSLVYFGETELLDERTFKNIHPKISQQNSLDLGEEFEPTFENALTSIWTGRCDYCNTEHFLCAKCGSLNEILDQEYNERKACEGCGLDYLIEVEDDEIGMPIETSYSILKPIKQCRYCGDEYDEDEFQQDEDICNDCLKELNEK